jgi:hypothetical protein
MYLKETIVNINLAQEALVCRSPNLSGNSGFLNQPIRRAVSGRLLLTFFEVSSTVFSYP